MSCSHWGSSSDSSGPTLLSLRLDSSSPIAVHLSKPLSASRAIAAGGTSILPSYFTGGHHHRSVPQSSSGFHGLSFSRRPVWDLTVCLTLDGLFGTPRSVFLLSPVWDSKVCLSLDSCLGLNGLSFSRVVFRNPRSVHHPTVCPSPDGLSIPRRSVHPPDGLSIP